MAGKTSRGTIIAVGIGVAAALAVLALVVSFSAGPDMSNPENRPALEMGPDTAGADPPGGGETLAQTAGLNDQTASTSPPGPDAPSPPVQTAAGDISYEQPWLTFSASFPENSDSDPVIAPLRAEAQAMLAKRSKEAKANYELMRREGADPLTWENQITWSYTARAGDIVSLLGEAMEFSGGAHPVTMFDAKIARDGKPIRFEDLMIVKRSPSPAMAIAMCEALKAEKVKRIGEATIFDEPIACAGPASDGWIETGKMVLAPSDKPGKFGGVHVYFSPYAVGAYAENYYIVTVQQDVFAEDLRPDVRPLFDGTAKAVS